MHIAKLNTSLAKNYIFLNPNIELSKSNYLINKVLSIIKEYERPISTGSQTIWNQTHPNDISTEDDILVNYLISKLSVSRTYSSIRYWILMDW